MITETPSAHVVCQSTISHVTVYGRGAVVTRSVSIPNTREIPTDAGGPYLLTLIVPDVTARAMHETARVMLEEGSPHELVAIHSDWTTIEEEEESAEEEPAEEEQQIEDLSQRLLQLNRNLSRAQERRARIDEIDFAHIHHEPWLTQGPVERLEQSLKLSKLLLHYAAKIDEYILTLQREIEETETQLKDLKKQEAQRSAVVSPGAQEPSSTFFVTLRCDPTQSCESFTLSYDVKEARWWPLYRLLLDRKTNQATFTIDAQVAQDSGEDWSNVAVDLSTATRRHDTSLPDFDPNSGQAIDQVFHDLTRMTTSKGSSSLFEAYEKFEALHFDLTPPKPDEETSPSRAAISVFSLSASGAYNIPGFDKMAKTQKVTDLSMSPEPYVRARQETIDLNHEQVLLKELSKDSERGLAELTSEFGEVPHPRRDTSAPAPRFEAFQLGEDEHREHLTPIEAESPIRPGSLANAIKEARSNALLDPRVTRGHYNYRYESQTRQSIPGDGFLHRIQLQLHTLQAAISWSTTPVEEETVFRLARVKNPFDVPMLSGPVEIFVGGNFLLSVKQHHVDPQEEFELSLGVEEHILVSREVITEQKQLDLHGDKTSTLHIVTTEITSRLDVPAEVLVLDRLPVSKSHNILVKEIEHKPPATAEDEGTNGHGIKGKRSWSLTLQPGETTLVQSQYAIILDSDLELKEGAPRD